MLPCRGSDLLLIDQNPNTQRNSKYVLDGIPEAKDSVYFHKPFGIRNHSITPKNIEMANFIANHDKKKNVSTLMNKNNSKLFKPFENSMNSTHRNINTKLNSDFGNISLP